MGIPAGNLCHRIVLERALYVTTSNGQRKTTGWAAIHARMLPASYRSVSGGESVRGRQVEATTTAVFEVRFMPQLAGSDAETLRVTWATAPSGPRVMGIVRIDDPDGLQDVLMIQAKAIK